VHSARYLDPSASYESRFADIERRLATVPAEARTARFVCALAVAAGDEVVFEATGVVEGTIASRARGSHGFGYDPIFFYPPFGVTLAEVSAERKLAVSHRGQAVGALRHWLANGGAQRALNGIAPR
jgi:XTP/dITP diphosphohydrolase